jgi:hypothetical protein
MLKECLKYLISTVLFVIFLNYWLIYLVNISEVIFYGILILAPTGIALVFVYRMLKMENRRAKFLSTIFIVGFLTIFAILFRFSIDRLIEHISTDLETGMFLLQLFYMIANILVVAIFNRVNSPRAQKPF